TCAGTRRSRCGSRWCSWRATTSAPSRVPPTTPIASSSARACWSSRAWPKRSPVASDARRGLLVDWGGGRTGNLLVSFSAFCEAEGLKPDALIGAFRGNRRARELLFAFEEGRIEEREFERELGSLLGVGASDGLIDRLFAGSVLEESMVRAV